MLHSFDPESLIQRLPKVELHLHLEGGIRPATLREIAQRKGRLLEETEGWIKEREQHQFRYPHFGEFLNAFKLLSLLLETPADYALAATRLIEDLKSLGSEVRATIENALSAQSFIPHITRVEDVDVRFGYQQWKVVTDRGPAEYRVQEREDIRFLPDGRFTIKDADGNMIAGTIEAETAGTIESIKRILAEEGATLADVVRVTTYLEDARDFGRYNMVFAEYFKDAVLARTTVEAIELSALGEATADENSIVPRVRDKLPVSLKHLHGKFARGNQHQGRNARLVELKKPFHHRNKKRQGLAGTGLRGGQHVLAFQPRRDGRCLNRRWH